MAAEVEGHGRPGLRSRHRRFLRGLLALRAGVRSDLREEPLSAEYVIGLVLSVLLLGYLSYALLRPERF